LGYVIQVNCITTAEQQNSVQSVPSEISEVLQQFDDIFADTMHLPRAR
jgi:hypothetical protein